MSATCKISGDFIVFEVTVYDGPQATHFDYDLPISDVQTELSVTKWKNHLREKRWATEEVIESFDRLVRQYWRNR